ncbi:MAG TPA: MBL fold metallo-hydrolase [Candidatus Gastranaerophilales bacterium]|nr:MBL fold metallo-hydrolase [Candidatus Gastranaerophilales bacterium]
MGDTFKFLKVGCGDCTVLLLGSKVVMIDCYQANNYGENIIDHIPNNVIDVLILTHQHYDHFLGIQTLLDNDIEVKEVWESPYDRRYGDNSVQYDEWQKYQTLVKKLEANGAKRYTSTRTEKIYDIIGGYEFYILNPVANINSVETRELHDASLVVMVKKVNSNKDKMIFCGDTSDWALDRVREKYNISGANILHASHHGSINGANIDFIKETSPNYTIVSTRSGVYSNVPSDVALQRYRSYTNKAVRRTDTDGTRVFS